MAFTDKVIDGGDILLKVNDKVIGCSTSHSIELTNAVREISCKGSGDFTSAEYGRFSWTVSTDALLNLGKDVGTYVSYSTLLALQLSKAVVDIDSVYIDADSGDTFTMSGSCIITSINLTAGDSENSSYSVSLQGRGAITITEGALVVLNAPVLGGTPAVPASTTMDLTWTDTNTSPNESGVRVEYKEDTSSNWILFGYVAPDALIETVTGLTAATDYNFRVVAVGNGDTTQDSVPSNVEDATTTA